MNLKITHHTCPPKLQRRGKSPACQRLQPQARAGGRITKLSAGFTIVEILVATAIFAVVVTLMLGLFNLTLRISRRTESLRQASQGMRNLVEFIVKEVRNGKIDYAVQNGNIDLSAVGGCPTKSGATGNTYGNFNSNSDIALGIVNSDNERECFYGAVKDGSGNVRAATLSDFQNNAINTLMFAKDSLGALAQPQELSPKNFKLDYIRFFVRPLCDPFITACTPKIQPSVTMAIEFTVTLPTGEISKIPYQTTIATSNYDIPSQ